MVRRRMAQTRATRSNRSHGAAAPWQVYYSVIFAPESDHCFYCEAPIDRFAARSFEVDHKTSPKRGGTHTRENLCVACPACNGTKGLMTEAEWRQCMADMAATPEPPVYVRQVRGAKLTPDDVRAIRKLYATGLTLKQVGAQFNTSHTNVSNIVNRKSWTHID